MAEAEQCRVCGGAATVHLTQVIDGKIFKVDLCENCAQDKGVTDPDGMSVAALMASTEVGAGAAEEENAEACPSCGMSVNDFRKVGRLGCPTCYTHFHDLLEPALDKMHPGSRHQGKRPEVPGRGHRRKELEEALAAAIAEERYEEAARFRDELKTLAPRGASGEGRADR